MLNIQLPLLNVTARLVAGLLFLLAVSALLSRFGTESSTPQAQDVSSESPPAAEARYASAAAAGPVQAGTLPRNAYYGDLHVHSSWSLDAYMLGGNRDDPSVAYRYGRGDTITRPNGSVIGPLRVPLDFMAVTDHEAWLGQVHLCEDVTDAVYNTPTCRDVRANVGYFELNNLEICGDSSIGTQNKCYERSRHLWHEIQENADAFYQPGTFTTFPAYEWTGRTHRNVIFRGEAVPEWGGSAREVHQNRPEPLWEWLESTCTGECQVLAIPHNTNWSRGVALAPRNSDGSPFTEEILTRRASAEPLVEIFQIKGNSECYVGLGTADEECNFELYYPVCAPGQEALCAYASNYVRNALKTGLTVEAEYGVNPFKYGFIASPDEHKSMPGRTDEQDFTYKFGQTGGIGQTGPYTAPFGEQPETGGNITNPGGLAGVWAAENTRESILDALKRREAFGTSGTRIPVRFFGGWTYADDLHTRRDLIEEAYATGVPMGADLPTPPAEAAAPRFVVWAIKDAAAANLQKIQIIKGWADEGQTYEEVYDVVCADGLTPDAETHRCADNGATVDLADCSYSGDTGAAELSTTWTDPAFDPSDRAFYYARVLENPTCRWTSYRALANQSAIPEPAVIKERAWSSPIWYTPACQ